MNRLTATSSRNAAYRRLHASARAMGLDEGAYRARLESLTGKRSAKDLTDAELARVLDAFHVKQTTAHPHLAKTKALFIAAFNLGAFETGSDAALDAFAKRQTGKERLAWLTPAEANAVTEALKSICARHGFVVEGDGMEARKALLRAQWAKLASLGKIMVADEAGLDGWVSKNIAGRRESHRTLKRHQLDQAAIRLGRWIRVALLTAETAAAQA
ncbi:MAG: phage protein GemA/Gp16 family protein [Rhizomicrobium sp.]